MGKGILKKKRTRLVALLAALCAFLAVGIGAGAAAASRAATKKSAEAASFRLGKGSGSAFRAALSSTDSSPLSFCETVNSKGQTVRRPDYSYCEGADTDAFNSSAQVNYLSYAPSQGQYTGWAGQAISASVTLGEGTQMPIAMPIGLWNGSNFINPNTMTPGQIENAMLNGDYMGNIGVISQYAGNKWYSFLGGVSYDGALDTPMNTFVKNNSSRINGDMLDDSINQKKIYLQPGSMQYQFQSLCNESEMLSNPYFALMTSNTVPYLQGVLQELFFGTGKNGEPLGLYNSDEAYYGSVPDSTVESDLKSLKAQADELIENVGAYKDAVAAYSDAVADKESAADARQAYLDSLKGSIGLDSDGQGGKGQPLMCLAVWDQNVGYASLPTTELPYTQGSDVSSNMGDAFNGAGSGTYPYAYWGAGPAYVGTGTASDSTLAMNVSAVATGFLETLLGSQANTSGIQLTAIYYPGQGSSFYTSGGGGVSVDIQPVKDKDGKVLLKGMGQYVSFRSLGLTPNNVNPTSIPATLSTSSPASDGLYFKAVSQSGEPLKSVEMELWPDTNSSYVSNWRWSGWIYTPIAPATNSAPKGVTSADWPYLGSTYWAGYYHPVSFTAQSLTSQPGWFDFSGVAAGVYEAKILGGVTEDGKQVSYGSYYEEPTLQIDATSYSSPEAVSASSDPCGFVNPSKDEVVVGAANPSSSLAKGASAPKSGTSDPYTATVGSSNPFTYQAEAYMPFDLSGQGGASSSPLSFSLSSLPSGEVVDAGSIEVNGKSLSSLGVTPTSSSSGFSFSLSPSQISSAGSQGGTAAVTWQAYLSSSWSSPGNPEYEFSYKAYSASNSGDKAMALTPEVETNGSASNSVPSSLTPGSTPSSSSGLWFKDLDPDGSPSSGAKFLVQNSSGDYLEEDTNSSGAFTGWSWTSSASAAVEFSQRNASALFSFGGLQDGTYTVTEVAWPDSVGKSSGENTGDQNWPGISSDLPAGGPDWAGYPGHLGGKAGYNGSFQVTLSYSSPEAMSTQADPAGLVDASQDSMYAFSPVKMAPMDGSSLSTQSYQTETVGIPFTEGWEGYLPMAVTTPTSTAGQNGYASELEVSFPESDSGLDNNGNSSGLEMDNPSTSNISVAGVPLSTLVSNGASVTTTNGDYSISLPYKALQYLEENGKNASGDSLSSSSNRLVIISFPAVMGTSFKNGGQFQQWMALGSGWWNQNAGSGWGVYSSPLYTNGPADNSLPSSLSMSSSSGSTGLWFKSLWWGRNTPAQGAKFTVSQTQGGKTVYLTPVENDKGFTGWSWKPSPYDFTEQNSDADFSMGGLQDGTYTVTEVDPAKGATPSSLTFTSSLSYSSPEALSDVKDSLHLLSSSQGVVYNMVVPSSLPLTGGSWVLIVSSAAVLLFAAGAVMFAVRKKRRA